VGSLDSSFLAAPETYRRMTGGATEAMISDSRRFELKSLLTWTSASHGKEKFSINSPMMQVKSSKA